MCMTSEKHHPQSNALTLCWEITPQDGAPAHTLEWLGRQGRQPVPPALAGAGQSHRGQHSGWCSDGHTARGSTPALQLLVFTNPVENTSPSILFQKDLCALRKKKRLINAVKPQGRSGGSRSAISRGVQIEARQSVGMSSVPCGRD